jgi:hypothetical protein
VTASRARGNTRKEASPRFIIIFIYAAYIIAILSWRLHFFADNKLYVISASFGNRELLSRKAFFLAFLSASWYKCGCLMARWFLCNCILGLAHSPSTRLLNISTRFRIHSEWTSCSRKMVSPLKFSFSSDSFNDYFCNKINSFWADIITGWTTTFRSPAEVKELSSSLCVHTCSEAHRASYPMVTGGLSPPVKRGRNVTLTTHPI